jgi:hypothetical protein
MGSYASIGVNGFEFDLSKNHVNPIWLTLFREVDKKNKVIIDEDNEDEERLNCEYSTTVRNMKLRLDIMGFTLTKAQIEFSNHNEPLQYCNCLSGNNYVEVEIKDYSFDNWLKSMEKIINSPYSHYIYYKEKIDVSEHPMQYHIMHEAYEGQSLFGFVSSDSRYVFRALLELFDDEESCVIDLSSLVDGGWCDENDRICDEALDDLAESHIKNERIILLTEGSSDISIIKRSMQILYPSVFDYYSFMDFNTSNASGSASSLVSYVKAFIGSGLRNKIIAIFDNDTAAQEAMRILRKIDVPSNILICSYPNLETAKNYPTLGPYGVIPTDINGLACSIELYLGIDVLRDEKGDLIPVQWKGYSQSLNKYQGEILNKELILQKYFKLLDKIEKEGKIDTNHDWSGIRSILIMIFKAFD